MALRNGNSQTYVGDLAANSNKTQQADYTANDGEGVVESYDLIPSGSYPVTFNSHEFISPSGLGPRIVVWFVVTSGAYAGCLIPWFCKVRITDREKGKFSIRKSSKYRTTMNALTGRPGQRRDRFPPSLLKGLKLLAEVTTVGEGQDGKAHSKEDCYSKIASLERDS